MNKREHPITILFRVFAVLKEVIFGIIPLFIFVLREKPLWFSALIILGIFLATALICTLQWSFLQYQIEENGVYVKRGVFVKKETFVNAARVQSVSTHASILHRAFQIERVTVETAGGTEPEIDLFGVPKETALHIIKILKDTHDDTHRSFSQDEKEEKEDSFSYRVSGKNMMLAGATSGKMGVFLLLLLTIWSQVEDWIPKWVITMVTSKFEHLSALSWTLFGILFVFLSWGVGTLHFMLKYYDFRVTRDEKKLYLSSGLLSKRNTTVQEKRIQGITIEEGIFRGLFGYASIQLEAVVSMKDATIESIVLHPFIRKSDIPQFLESVLPNYTIETLTEYAPLRSRKRFLFLKMFLSLVLACGVTYWKTFLFPSFLLVVLSAWNGYACFRSAGFHIKGKQLTLSYRILSKYTTITHHKHIQSMGYKQHPFQKKDHMGNTVIYILSGLGGKKVKVKQLDESQHHIIQTWFNENKRKKKA